MIDLKEPRRDYLSTPQAAERAGLSTNYLAALLRKGVLEGFQLGRDWFVYTDSLERFLSTPRKPGPKGPRKPLTRPSNDTADQRYGEV